MWTCAVSILLLSLACQTGAARAQLHQADVPGAEGAVDEGSSWSLHAQATNVTQVHPAFTSPYEGANSLAHANGTNETFDATAFIGRGLWSGAALYANPEIDQGFGLSNTLGVAGYPSGEAYKLGFLHPYFRLPRAFLRQSISLGGEGETVELADGANQLAQSMTSDDLVLTAGKFSVVDIFDTNRYAHDPRGDFLNWAVIESGAFDYPADPWGFTYGATAEWTHAWWTLRGGFFALSKTPNGRDIDGQFDEHGWVAEFEVRQDLEGHPGKWKLLGFDNLGRMGSYDAALAVAAATDQAPNTALVRRYGARTGFAMNVEQELTANSGVFLRASANDGSKETFDFTDINRSLSFGYSLQGAPWRRPNDTVGIAAAIDAISSEAQAYFADGGMGILIGDGALDYGKEKIVETYYSWKATANFTVSGDYQVIINPAYNRERGPVSVFGLRLHGEF
jgi:high affinity Mn2+ porin